MSNILRTRTLATRFLDGETTIAEEQELCQLLQSDDLPADLLPLRQMVSDLSLIALPPEASEAKPVRWAPASGSPWAIKTANAWPTSTDSASPTGRW